METHIFNWVRAKLKHENFYIFRFPIMYKLNKKNEEVFKNLFELITYAKFDYSIVFTMDDIEYVISEFEFNEGYIYDFFTINLKILENKIFNTLTYIIFHKNFIKINGFADLYFNDENHGSIIIECNTVLDTNSLKFKSLFGHFKVLLKYLKNKNYEDTPKKELVFEEWYGKTIHSMITIYKNIKI